MNERRTISIGCGQHVDIRIDGTSVQDRHALICLEDDETWYLSDLAGDGTTRVNGQAVGLKRLNPGDSIQIGTVNLEWPAEFISITPAVTAEDLPAIKSNLDLHTGRAASKSDRRISIGSDPSADIEIHNPGVESRHATLLLTDEQWTIFDNSRSNATWVNGKRIGHKDLSDGDVITIGSYSTQWPFTTDTAAQHHSKPNTQIAPQPNKLGPQLRFTDVSIVNFENKKPIPIQLDSVNLNFSPGTVNAIIGPSAIGKSTLIRALIGEAQIVHGEIKMNSFTLSKTGMFPPQILSYVPQHDNLIETLTVWEYLVYASRVRNSAKSERREHEQIVTQLLESLDLSDAADKQIDKLSGGQKKRVSVASELVTEPQLLILDEPSSGLDEGLDRLLVSLLRRIARKSNMIVLIVTHAVLNLDLADSVTLIGAPPAGQPKKSRSIIAFNGKNEDLLKRFRCRTYADLFDTARNSDTYECATTNQKCRRQKRQHLSLQPTVSILAERRLHENGYIRWKVKFKPSSPGCLAARSSDLLMPSALIKSGLAFTAVTFGCASMLTYVGSGFGGQIETNAIPPNVEIIRLLQLLVTIIAFLVMRQPVVSFTEKWRFMKRELMWGINPIKSLQAQVLVDSPWIFAFPTITIVATQALETLIFKAFPIPTTTLVWFLILAVAFAFACYAIGMLITVSLAEKDSALISIVFTVIALTITTGVIVPLGDGEFITNLMWLSPARLFISGAASTLDHEALIGRVFDPAFSVSLYSPYIQLVCMLAIALLAIQISMLKINHTVNKY
ncbi:FHA domain-containing protein [Schaalia cardiffensis]|uniref:FHA domain-containing protein n=1 Tax=Schaalia cardiffensis TaxID=181487 RepID=UPI0023F34951|nr:FHA domain-containing protein [Schaalia cardiffensis]